MFRKTRKTEKKIAAAPGTVIYTGFHSTGTKMSLISFDETGVQEQAVTDPETLSLKDGQVHWLNVTGLEDTAVLEAIGRRLQIHSLTLEDIASITQRPKAEDFESYFYYVLKMIYLDKEGSGICFEQVSLVLGKNLVVSFQEMEGDVFDHIRERIREDKGLVRKMGANYLFYLLADAIIDNYFIVIESCGERLNAIEDALLEDADNATLLEIHGSKTDILRLRKAIRPLYTINGNLARLGSTHLGGEIGMYLRDLNDHTIQVIDTLEIYRDTITGLQEVYLSMASNKMNEIMKVLTIFASIFIPLTFLAGWYGMNFKFMPELDAPFAYFIMMGIAVVTTLIMVLFFRKKKWIGRSRRKNERRFPGTRVRRNDAAGQKKK
jgi:magnesium transporter